MPEFQLDCGTKHVQYRALDEFTQGYFECAFFCGVDGIDEANLHLGLLAPETWDRVVSDCNDFQASNATALADATAGNAARYDPTYDMRQAGRDFWYSRNDHGAGYFARGLLDATETALEEAATRAGQCDLYLGDDGSLYL